LITVAPPGVTDRISFDQQAGVSAPPVGFEASGVELFDLLPGDTSRRAEEPDCGSVALADDFGCEAAHHRICQRRLAARCGRGIRIDGRFRQRRTAARGQHKRQEYEK